MKDQLAFGKRNFILLGISILLIVLGFFVMSLDTEAHGFGALGLTVGPIISMSGFALTFYAILAKKNNTSEK